MAGFDPFGGQRIQQGGGGGGGRRYRRDVYQDDDGGYFVSDGRRMRPAQINIINENNVVDDRADYYEPPRGNGRVYVQDQQIVQVARGRSPSDSNWRVQRELFELERIQRERDEQKLAEQIEADLIAKAAKQRDEELKRAEEEKALKKKAVEDWQAEQEKKKKEEKEKAEANEKMCQEYLRQQLRKEGWTEDEIEEAIKRKDNKKPEEVTVGTTIVLAESRKKYVKVHKKHIAPETLDAYKLEWTWASDGFIYIYATLTESDQEILFEHTRKLKEQKLIKFAEVETIAVKGIDRDRAGRLVVVRRKDRARSKSPAVAVKKAFFLN